MDMSQMLAMIMASGGGGSSSATPAMLNAMRASDRNTQQSGWRSSVDSAYNTQRNNIINQFTQLGIPEQAAPYLAALQSDYNGMKYTAGSDYSIDPSNPGSAGASGAWDEQAYLAAHPDVAQQVALHSQGKEALDPNYWHSGLDFYNALGKNSPGYQVAGYGTPGYGAVAPSYTGGSADTFDDPNKIAQKDYLTGFTPPGGSPSATGNVITDTRLERKNAARDAATGTITSRLGGMGLGADDLASLTGKATDKVTGLYNKAGLSANDYSDVFDPNAILDSVVGDERTGRRAGYSTQARTAFNGLDPNLQLADTADDPYISDIIGTKYNDASGALDRAYKRGALTDTGYNAGLGTLGKQKSAADVTGQTLGGAVLTRDRTALSDIKGSALTDAGAWDFGQTFDPGKYTGQYNAKLGEFTNNLGGEIAGALQGQNFFDVGEALNTAGYAQGAQNTPSLTSGYTTPAAAAIAGARDKNKTDTRGIGGTGLF